MCAMFKQPYRTRCFCVLEGDTRWYCQRADTIKLLVLEFQRLLAGGQQMQPGRDLQ